MQEGYIKLGNLEVYKMSFLLSQESWKIYDKLNWQDKKVIGDQFITAVDSVGANIAEGYGRFHYKDRIKFYYNSRGSLIESKHWALLLLDRRKIAKEEFDLLLNKLEAIHKMINSHIKACYKNIK